jgi:riboflavin kinase/FMN adenylyltransferase
MSVARDGLPLSRQAAREVARGSVAAALGPLPSGRDLGTAETFDLAGIWSGCGRPACSVAIGAFDGLHLGHRRLVARMLEQAHEDGQAGVIVTFAPDPDVVISPNDAAPKLLSVDDRLRGLCGLGIDAVVRFRFTPDLARRSYGWFFDEALARLVDLRAVHVGSDFRIGAGGAGSVPRLRELGVARGFGVVGHRLVRDDGLPVSASRIRAAVGRGEVDEAAELLGRLHYVGGEVRHGRGEGASLGFATANVACAPDACLPAAGVYSGFATVDGLAWPAAINVGAPPSFETPEGRIPSLEAHLVGFSGDLYGRRLLVSFLGAMRSSRPFSSVADLERVVRGNIDWVRTNLGEGPLEVGA